MSRSRHFLMYSFTQSRISMTQDLSLSHISFRPHAKFTVSKKKKQPIADLFHRMNDIFITECYQPIFRMIFRGLNRATGDRWRSLAVAVGNQIVEIRAPQSDVLHENDMS